MFISKLIHIIEVYDPYGEHRVNGVKAVYVLLILFSVNFIFSIPNPYFYFFYTPITSMAAEIAGDTIRRKNLLLFYCILWSAVSSFLFDLFSVSPFFPIFVFFYSYFLYSIAVKSRMHRIVIAPVALSLGAYSLLYGAINQDYYIILNNFLTTLVSMSLVFAALALFPRGYYYRLWLRALGLFLDQMMGYLSLMASNKRIVFDPVRGHLIHLVRFSSMLPRSFPLSSIWDINLLVNQLYLLICVAEPDRIMMEGEKIQLILQKLRVLSHAVEQERPCDLAATPWVVVNKLVTSWNVLCLKI